MNRFFLVGMALILSIITACGTETTPTYTILISSSPSEGGSVAYTPTGSPQDEGTSLTFTATPSEGYFFSQWQGDLSGTLNPSSLTLNKNVTVTAVFEKKTYPLTITIEGEGTVKEEVIQAKTDYVHGTTVRLTPQPNEGWIFSRWSGEIDSEIAIQEVTVTTPVNLTAKFTKTVTRTWLDDLSEINKTTSWFTGNKYFSPFFHDFREEIFDNILFIYEDKDSLILSGNQLYGNGVGSLDKEYQHVWKADWLSYAYFDMNGDGEKDLFHHYIYRYGDVGPEASNLTDYENWNSYDLYSENVSELFLKAKEINIKNHISVGVDHVRKIAIADVNNDQWMELVLFSTGWDAPPFPGDSLAIFYPRNKTYTKLEEVGFFHGGATGDVDKDGDIDIIAYSGNGLHPIRPLLLRNSNGKFIKETGAFINFTHQQNFYMVELLDINNDGYLDLILGAGLQELQDQLVLIFGNAEGTYNYESKLSLLPNTTLVPIDVDFYDFNEDGRIDILINAVTLDNQDGELIVLVQRDNYQFMNETETYLDTYQFKDGNIFWIYLIDVDNDGDLDIYSDATGGEYYDWGNTASYWENINGKFFERIQCFRLCIKY